MKRGWKMVGIEDGPAGELIFVYRSGRWGTYTYEVCDEHGISGGTYRTRSWMDAMSHYNRTTTSWDEKTEPQGFCTALEHELASIRTEISTLVDEIAAAVCPFTDEESTVRPAAAL